MKIYYLQQDEYHAYDTYDSCVVVAESAEEAVLMHPARTHDDRSWISNREPYPTWASHPDQVQVECIGEATTTEKGVVCASFNAG